ncbi:helix-turn-helix domain-containing protein [Mycolicibacterium flavescens]|uniref:PucR family transcriptional regulator n=1 Tax=Mycolicibacterium flavescens TaxID=1776 RepID=A0A1E3RPI4_MYCFV|nr:helix-turn-helix domain-containing protein [Mycolicibacterium flavescens]MCV7283279.1 helix-turn-helix domain-containing protein [Mycolicibacterium flavescens]ODQ91803.1 PucR family transcriptional regulator [Mycolicibacterium flavescens]
MLNMSALLVDGSLELTLLVVGAPDAVDREVLWLHNTELPDPSPYIRETELVLTNGLWRSSVTAEAFVAALVRARAAGLIFGLTVETPSVPEDLVDACARVDMPLAELSIAVPFTAITQAAARIQERARQDALVGLVRRGNALASSISRGAGAAGVIDVLRRDHDLPLLVVDRLARRLAGTVAGDDALRVCADALTRRPPPLEVDLPGIGSASLFLVEGAVGDIDAGLFCLRPLKALEPIEREALDQAARFLSLEVTKQQALQAIEARFSSELLEMILSGTARASEVPERLRAFGIDPRGPMAVLTLIVGEQPIRPAGSTDAVEQFFSARSIPVVTVAGSQDTVLVFPWNDTSSELVGLAEQLVGALERAYPGDRVVVGVGELAADCAGLREPLIRSREACRVLRRRGRGRQIATFTDVGTHRMLLGLHDRDVLRRFADDILSPLRLHDGRNGTELELTLRTFLGNDSHWSTTAAALYIHVNTLRNRVARINELTGRDLARLEDRVDLFLALEADALAG